MKYTKISISIPYYQKDGNKFLIEHVGAEATIDEKEDVTDALLEMRNKIIDSLPIINPTGSMVEKGLSSNGPKGIPNEVKEEKAPDGTKIVDKTSVKDEDDNLPF